MQGADFNWAGVLSLAVALVGWIFVYHNTRALARQSEANSIVAAVEKMLQEIVSDASKFWGCDEEDKSDGFAARVFTSSVELKCNFIEHKVSQLERKCRKLSQWHPEPVMSNIAIDMIGNLRNFATLDCESIKTMSDDDREMKILSVNATAMKLYTHLTDFIANRYKSIIDSTYETFESREPK